MVRLKVELQESKQSPYKHFNSYMVRLKVESQSAKADQLLFQFLYGTIKSPHSFCKKTRKTYFNSYMVRLKVYLYPHYVQP